MVAFVMPHASRQERRQAVSKLRGILRDILERIEALEKRVAKLEEDARDDEQRRMEASENE